MKFALVVPTLNPGSIWEEWLHAYASQSVKPDFSLIIDSESQCKEIELSNQYGFKTIRIKRNEFNHGGTRHFAVLEVAGKCDVVVFLTQDAFFANSESLLNILKPFADPRVAATYGRQLPNKDASLFAQHARLFNYPDTSRVQSLEDIPIRGIKTCFISNSFAAYRIKDLLEIGGFPANIIFGEDNFIGARLILAGKQIAYVADAVVLHSHNYNLVEEFKRCFDIGVFHNQNSWILKNFGVATNEGKNFALSEFKSGLEYSFILSLYSIIRSATKIIAYKLGRSHKYMPRFIKLYLSMNGKYWLKTHERN